MYGQGDIMKMHRKVKSRKVCRYGMDMGEGIDCECSGDRWVRVGIESQRLTFLTDGIRTELAENQEVDDRKMGVLMFELRC